VVFNFKLAEVHVNRYPDNVACRHFSALNVKHKEFNCQTIIFKRQF